MNQEENLPHYYNKEKDATVGDLHRVLSENIQKNPEVADYPVLIDTEARCFNAHMFGVSGVFVEEHPEKHLGIHLQGIGSQRVNRDEYIDLIKMCVVIEKLDAHDTQTLAQLKAQATDILEYYRRQLQ